MFSYRKEDKVNNQNVGRCMQTLDDLKEQLYNNSNAISLTFIKNYLLRFDKAFEHLPEPLLRWQYFVLRYILPKPREVLFSKEIIEKLTLPDMNALKKSFL